MQLYVKVRAFRADESDLALKHDFQVLRFQSVSNTLPIVKCHLNFKIDRDILSTIHKLIFRMHQVKQE